MSSTLTVSLDSDLLQLAEQEARSRQTTLSDVVRQQLHVMAENWKDSQSGQTPVTDSLRGAIKLPKDFDKNAVLAEELLKKHGVHD